MARILVVDRDDGRRKMFQVSLGKPEHNLVLTHDGIKAIELLGQQRFDAIFCDYNLPTEQELLRKAREIEPNPWFVDMVEDEDQAAKAVLERNLRQKFRGADAYIPWSFNLSDIDKALKGMPKASPEKTPLPTERPYHETANPMVEEMDKLVARIAANDKPVLICGEPGTGKRTLASRIHERSARGKAGGPLKEFRCAPVDVHFLESELFGHTKGAFPWAKCDKPGLLHEANGGTLLLTGADRLDQEMQRKLLSVLGDPLMRFVSLGGRDSTSVNVRIMATALGRLNARLTGGLSADLFSRLAENYIELPPLRARTTELTEFLRLLNPDGVEIKPTALEILRCYPWPENFRELRSALKFALLRCDNLVEVSHLPAYIVAAVSRQSA